MDPVGIYLLYITMNYIHQCTIPVRTHFVRPLWQVARVLLLLKLNTYIIAISSWHPP